MQITQCPTCGSTRIAKVQRDWAGEFQGKKYRVEALEFYECPVCGERILDREAMRRIEAQSPAFKSRRPKRAA
jgi:YgiT-type zinc finger domain-containing protein